MTYFYNATNKEDNTCQQKEAKPSPSNSSRCGEMKSSRGGAGSIADLVYPVGAIYLSTSSTSPQTLFGGTWQRIQDRFLLCAGSTYAAGKTGGEAKHTLTVNEIPNHTHAFKWVTSGNGSLNRGRYFCNSDSRANDSGSANTQASNAVSENEGGGQSHNNMPPYLAVYAWKRTA